MFYWFAATRCKQTTTISHRLVFKVRLFDLSYPKLWSPRLRKRERLDVPFLCAVVSSLLDAGCDLWLWFFRILSLFFMCNENIRYSWPYCYSGLILPLNLVYSFILLWYACHFDKKQKTKKKKKKNTTANTQMRPIMRKAVYAICEQQRRRSACAFA